MQKYEKVLIVEDCVSLQEALVSYLDNRADKIKACDTLSKARAILTTWQPTLTIMDYKLPDGVALDLIENLSHASPAHNVIVMSAHAKPIESFKLASLGVRTYIQKPFNQQDFQDALNSIEKPPNFVPHIRTAVSHVGLKEMEICVRKTMVEEALSRADNNRRAAARYLRVSRQFLQHFLRKIYSDLPR